MFDILYNECFEGIAVGRVARDENFTANLGKLKNEYQIQYIFDGVRYFFANGSCYKMDSGCIALIDKKMIPKTCIIGGHYHDRLLIELKGDIFIPLAKIMGFNFEKIFSDNYGVLKPKDPMLVKEFMGAFENIIYNKDEFCEFRLKTKILELLLLIEKYKNNRIPKFESSHINASISKQLRIHEVADYITEHYSEITSVEELAKRFYMSKSYLCRVFNEVINFTITEYINLYRIAMSKQYLLYTRYSITEIANFLGYNSLTYFERSFKKIMMVTPMHYRKIKGLRKQNLGISIEGK